VKPIHWTLLVIGLLVVSLAALFTVQNSARMTDLSLDLFFTALHLKHPVAVPYLLWGTLFGGFLTGFVVGRIGRSRADRDAPAPYAPSTGGSTSSVGDDWT
jgi:uncharacterized integral membrane protein